MDDALELRLQVFTDAENIDPSVVPVVRDELNRLALPADRRTDEVLGIFTSHLVNALNRAVRGEPLTVFEAQDVVDAAIAERPDAYDHARELARRAEQALGVDLPDTEVRLLGLHLATI
ncbi:PRD domain-containing protein [Cellulomonas denverensis]|uniref:PRD domain-containing protein n=1 Tax=Cellulomonas denverensis TaxID=264297 RepID=A0A7X6KXT5_9CELL|nr:PRD domain-containing protein [Cellulomonas denverensis]NKY23960.1 PRD domain-containing protein [Cellulomonas denverensis]GIG24917.1 hypothetical protein Cde04nite_11610 [Cellulomonas denverensis]